MLSHRDSNSLVYRPFVFLCRARFLSARGASSHHRVGSFVRLVLMLISTPLVRCALVGANVIVLALLSAHSHDCDFHNCMLASSDLANTAAFIDALNLRMRQCQDRRASHHRARLALGSARVPSSYFRRAVVSTGIGVSNLTRPHGALSRSKCDGLRVGRGSHGFSPSSEQLPHCPPNRGGYFKLQFLPERGHFNLPITTTPRHFLAATAIDTTPKE